MIDEKYMNTMKNRALFSVLALVVALAFGGNAAAQAWSQQTACPGWNNPNSFTQGNSNCYYSAAMGNAGSKTQPSVMGEGSYGFTPTNFYTASQIAAIGDDNVGCHASSNGSRGIPRNHKQFCIMSTADQQPGYPANSDPNTQSGSHYLHFVPTEFNTFDTTGRIINTALTKSIRVGDDCTKPGMSANVLYYHIKPTSQNGMLFLYYSVVVEKPVHGIGENPAFMIRVTKKNSSNQYVQITDTLAYAIVAGFCGDMESNINVNGWHQVSGPAGPIQYKDWVKVAINLGNLLYENLRIEVVISDCKPNYHYGYAYIAGECRPMALSAEGCPAGRATNVTTVSAPRGMLNYEWAASRFGVSDVLTDLNPGQANSHFSFRTLASGTEANGFADYEVQANDFRVNYRTRTPGQHDSIAVDSVGKEQTIRCRMTSAIDPAKPFTTNLYINVKNIKPTMRVDSLSYCNGDILMRNTSYVPGMTGGVLLDSTRWYFYNNAACGGQPDTMMLGDSAIHHYEGMNRKGVVVRTYSDSTYCWSEAQYVITPKQNPKVGMTISDHVLCDADQTTITDTTSSTVRRQWTFLNENSSLSDANPVYDTIVGYYGDERVITRGFTHNVEPISLNVRNGKFYLNPYRANDTIWCQNTTHDTVAVFVHPDLRVEGDTIVCRGSLTDATVSAVGVNNCTYEWSRTYGTITGGIPSGAHLAVAPYADTSVYYVRVTTQEGCVAWDSIHAYLVVPVLTMLPTDGLVCPGDEAILTGSAADHYTWSSSPADPTLAGQETADRIMVRPQQTTTYTMVGHGTNDCNASPLTSTVTVRPLPVPRITTDPGFVDGDNPTITLRDVSPNSVRSEWLFNNSELVEARELVHTFEEAVGKDSVYVKLTAYNVLDCPSEKVFPIPVTMFTAWLPNIFTPGREDGNDKFRLYSVNEYEEFHIYIYNRGGQLMFESTDPHFEWDGTYKGDPCQQGAYVYVCNYRKPNTTTLITKSGSVTLVR